MRRIKGVYNKMNTVKYRALAKDGTWRYGLYPCMNVDMGNTKYPMDIFWNNFLSSFRRETLGQWTGLLDKQSKEIYEGDIIKVVEDITDTPFDILGKRYGFRTPSELGRRSIYGREFIAPVIWNDKSTGFTLAYRWADTGEVDDHIRINPRESEVIGNIYEKAPIPMLLFYESKAQERIEKAKEGENDN